MTTTETTLVIILVSLLSLFFILCIVLVGITIKLINSVRRVVAKAETAVQSVEEAAEVFKNAEGKLAIVNLIRNIVKMTQRSRK